jgi:hypothetical protein
VVLHGRLHTDVIDGRQILCGGEVSGSSASGPNCSPEAAQRIVGHLFL